MNGPPHRLNRGCPLHFCGDYKVMVSPVVQMKRAHVVSGLLLCMQDSQIASLHIYLKHFMTNMENSELRQAVCSGAFMHVFNPDNQVMETIHTYHLSIVCMKALVKCYL